MLLAATGAVWGASPGDAASFPAPLGPPGTAATYRLASAGPLRSNSVERFTLSFGPVEPVEGVPCQWLALHAGKANGQHWSVWVLARRFPPRRLDEAARSLVRYVLQEDDDAPREFTHRRTGAPVLPTSGAWEYLWPRPEADAPVLAARRVFWLGHPYAREAGEDHAAFRAPSGICRLALLPDVMVGVPSNTRTKDDTRRYDGSDYPMVRLTRADYAAMIDAGMNCLRVDAEQAGWLRTEPVFYWGPGAAEVPFPESLFRSTYLGPALFLDEPAVGTRDFVIRPRLAREPELRQRLTPQIMLEAFQAHFHEAVRQGAPAAWLNGLRARTDVHLGALQFSQRNLFSWETMIASAAWELTAEPEGGPDAIVFEPPGRLGTRRTLPEMNMAYGCELAPDNPAHLAGLIFGFLRGAARVADKEWGVSIYGAVDQADAPWLLTHAYDLGATRFFFWDNYQLACVPFGECLALSRQLQAHARAHPDRDLGRLRRAAEVALLLPPGYNLGHTHMGRGNLWGLGELNLERTNRLGVRYRQVMTTFFTEVERCLRLGVAFDLFWDLDGLRLDGYREVVRVKEDGRVDILASGQRSVRPGARVPERPAGQAPRLVIEVSGPLRPLPCTLTARARVTEGSAPVYYTKGADRSGVHQNAWVLWELYGPAEDDYQMLGSRLLPPEPGDSAAAVVEARFTLEQPGRYRLRAATTDLAGRSAVVWTDLRAGE